MIRVDVMQLEDRCDGGEDVFYRGRLFTGIAVEENRDTGKLVGQICYLDGRMHGPSRAWYPTGLMQQEEYFRNGARHGSFREWDEQGGLIVEEVWEYYVPIMRRRWSPDGSLVREVLLVEGSGTKNRWMELRARRGKQGIVELDGDEFVEMPWPFDWVVGGDAGRS